MYKKQGARYPLNGKRGLFTSTIILFKGGNENFARSEQNLGGKFSNLEGGEQKFAPSGRYAAGKFSKLGGGGEKFAASQQKSGGKLRMAGGKQ